MNVLFVADVSIARIIGGGERVLYEQCTRLAQRGHNVHIITRKTSIHRSNLEVINGVSGWRYKCNWENAANFLITTIRNSMQLFERICKNIQFDCLNFYQPFTGLGVICSPLGKNLYRIYTCHSLSFEEFISRRSKGSSLINILLGRLQVKGRKWSELTCLMHPIE